MLGVDLFKKNLIRDADAIELFEAMAWLIQRYGPPRAPKVPSPLHRNAQLTDILWDEADQRLVFDWAQDAFIQLKQDCGMQGWSVQIMPAPEDNGHLQHMLFAKKWNMASEEPYRVDNYGRPVILFDPRRCDEPGTFATRVILKLSEIQLMNFEPEKGVSPILGAMLILCSSAFTGQGFHLLPLTEMICEKLSSKSNSPPLPARVVENSLIFSACLGLLALNRCPEQIVATYGCLLTPALRKRIMLACRQIEKFDVELETLKLLVNGSRSHGQSSRIQALTA